MRENTANSVVISLLLHGLLVGVILLATYFVAQQTKEAPVIFELVAGPRTSDAESLEAPALGTTDKPIKLEVPVVETIASMPEPETVPVVQTEPEEAAVEPPPAEKPKPPVKPVAKAKPDTSMANELKKKQKMSYQEYLRKHPTPKPSAAAKSTGTRKVATGPRIDATGIAKGVQGGSAKSKSGEGGKALTREQQDQMSTYISLLIQELKRAHEPPPGVSDKLEARVTFDITASGAIMNPRISKSSGDKDFDESVIEAFLRMRSIGPTPNRRSDTWTVTFRMRDDE